jgi:hypothetical protein
VERSSTPLGANLSLADIERCVVGAARAALFLIQEAAWIRFLFAAFFTSNATSSFPADVVASRGGLRIPVLSSQT